MQFSLSNLSVRASGFLFAIVLLSYDIGDAFTNLVSAEAQAPSTERVEVTIENFTRAETDRYLKSRVDAGGLSSLYHSRAPVSIDKQPVVRANRDNLLSYGVFDLTTPVTITLPDPGERFQSLRAINQDHYIVTDTYEPGSHTFTEETVGTRYLHLSVRILGDPDDPEDLAKVHALQDQIIIEQAEKGDFVIPNWNAEQRDQLRKAIIGLVPFTPDSVRMFGAKTEVDPVKHLIGTAGGWGGGPTHAAYYENVTPISQTGSEVLEVRVDDVPVDAFWSISVYNAEGFFEPNAYGAGYSINSVTAKPSEDGSVTLRFGGDPDVENFLNVFEGWNYTVRYYRPREELLSGAWRFPTPTSAE